jgi:hypothetical protein
MQIPGFDSLEPDKSSLGTATKCGDQYTSGHFEITVFLPALPGSRLHKAEGRKKATNNLPRREMRRDKIGRAAPSPAAAYQQSSC